MEFNSQSMEGRERLRARAIAWLCWILIVILWVAAVLEWPGLPARIPVHFDVAGRPDSFADKSVEVWFMLPLGATLLNVGLMLLFPAVRWLAARYPGLINMPSRAWYGLDTEARLRALEPLKFLLRLLRLVVTSLFLYVVVGTAQVAGGAWPVLPVQPVFVPLAAILAGVVWLVVASRKAVQKEAKDSASRS